FACTCGKSISEQVAAYLDGQGEHHGYAGRVLPPIHVETLPLTAALDQLLQANHAFVRLRLHQLYPGDHGEVAAETAVPSTAGPLPCSAISHTADDRASRTTSKTLQVDLAEPEQDRTVEAWPVEG